MSIITFLPAKGGRRAGPSARCCTKTTLYPYPAAGSGACGNHPVLSAGRWVGAQAATVNAPRARRPSAGRAFGLPPVSMAPGRRRQWEGQGAGHVPARRGGVWVSWRPGGTAGAELLRGWSRQGEKALSVRAPAVRAARAPPRCPPAPSKGGAGRAGPGAFPAASLRRSPPR